MNSDSRATDATLPQAADLAARRIAAIRDALASLAPEQLELEDQSHLHVGHASAGGLGHYRVRIVAAAFAGKSLLERHRLVYRAMGTLLQTDVHALTIEAWAPEETGSK